MCGIAGFLVKNRMNYSGNLSEQATHMSAAIISRGPDDRGVDR
jgi:asparagine synthetase B (glutamine-hydrolysing)